MDHLEFEDAATVPGVLSKAALPATRPMSQSPHARGPLGSLAAKHSAKYCDGRFGIERI